MDRPSKEEGKFDGFGCGAGLKILHVVPGVHPNAGGPSRTVVQLCDSLGRIGIEVGLLGKKERGEPEVVSRNSEVKRMLFSSRKGIIGSIEGARRGRCVEAVCGFGPEVLHNNGMWHPLNHWCASVARRFGIPSVIQPHGMLEPWALAWRSWKKNLALWAYQRRDLEGANVLVAAAEQEAEGFRQFGLRQPIAIIPNGVELDSATGSMRQVEVAATNSPRRALFLSRIHPIKGLLNLLDAWAALDSPDWLLQFAGPDEVGHLAEVQQRISALGLQDRVQYLGSIDDAHKGAVYAAAGLFILPSFSENFGVVVAEALSHGLPVIATRGTPWQGLEQHGCGWWVEPTVDGLAGALRDAVAREPAQLREMGMRGQVYAHEFEWGNIAKQTADVYRWILGQGDRPDCVYLD